MKTFAEFQTLANQVPASLRNNLDRINLPATGLQETAGSIASQLSRASASGHFCLTPEQRSQLHDQLSDNLWYMALLCEETGITLPEVATHAIAQLQERVKQLDPDQR